MDIYIFLITILILLAAIWVISLIKGRKRKSFKD